MYKDAPPSQEKLGLTTKYAAYLAKLNNMASIKKGIDNIIAFRTMIPAAYRSVSEYVRELTRADEKRRAEERLEALLLRGLDSPANVWTQEDTDHIKQAVRERFRAKQQPA